MNNKILKIGLLIVVMCFVIGCGKDDNEPKALSIVGTWYWCEDGKLLATVTFNSNNTYTVQEKNKQTETGTYKIESNLIIITGLTGPYGKYTESAEFELGKDDGGDYLLLGEGKWRRYSC